MEKQDKVRISVRVPRHLVEDSALDGFKSVSEKVVKALQSQKLKKQIDNQLAALDLFKELGRNRFLDSEGRDERKLEHGAPIVGERGTEIDEWGKVVGAARGLYWQKGRSTPVTREDLEKAQENLKGFLEEATGSTLPACRPSYSIHERALNSFRDERERQVVKKGHTPELDARHNVNGQLGRAAAAYATASEPFKATPQRLWPWNPDSFKPDYATPSDSVTVWVAKRKRQLEKAGALLLAEWERIDKLVK